MASPAGRCRWRQSSSSPWWAISPSATAASPLNRWCATARPSIPSSQNIALLAVLGYIGFYIVAVALSLPGAAFLTVAGGFLFGIVVGRLGGGDRRHHRCHPHLSGGANGARRATAATGGPARQSSLRKGFRDDAFSYLLFLRLVPAFPFFLVNLVPAFAGRAARPVRGRDRAWRYSRRGRLCFRRDRAGQHDHGAEEFALSMSRCRRARLPHGFRCRWIS